MAVFFQEHAQWLTIALIVMAVVVALTIFGFQRKRFADRGPKKGVAKRPAQVRQQNPPDHRASRTR